MRTRTYACHRPASHRFASRPRSAAPLALSAALLAVTNGTCQIGVTTTAAANQSVTLDDFTFVRTGS